MDLKYAETQAQIHAFMQRVVSLKPIGINCRWLTSLSISYNEDINVIQNYI